MLHLSRKITLASLLILTGSLTLNAQNFMTHLTPESLGNSDTNVGDFNEDGIMDVVTVGIGGTSDALETVVTVSLGKSNGMLGTRKNSLGSQPTIDDIPSVSVGKFTNSGHLDLAVAHSDSHKVDILLGKGDGTFKLVKTIPSGTAVTAGDFDHDGNTDVAIADGATIRIYPGNGDGTFRDGVTVPNTFTGSVTYPVIYAANFDGDSRTDFVVVNASKVISVFFNNGGLTFKQVDIPIDEAFRSLTVADVNHDGYADLLVSSIGPDDAQDYFYGNIDVFRSKGKSRSFTHAYQTTMQMQAAIRLIAADVDRDGITDIAAATCGDSCGMSIFRGLANGTFAFDRTYYGPTMLASADFNRDGRPDFAVAAFNTGSFGTSLNALPQTECTNSTLSPSVTVCGAVDGGYVKSPLHLTVKTTDMAHAVTTIQVYVENKFVTSVKGSTFSPTLTLTPGTHSIVLKAYDSSGASFLNRQRVTVFTATPGQTCSATLDTVHICVPSAGATANSPVRVFAAASNPKAISAFQVYVSGKLVVDDRLGSNYIDQRLTMSPGSHSITVKFFDTAGNKASATRTINVQ